MESNKNKLCEIAKCTICWDIARHPIYQCSNGHIFCEVCINELDTCASCQVILSEEKLRNRALEHVMETFQFKCFRGCSELLTFSRADQHYDCKASFWDTLKLEPLKESKLVFSKGKLLVCTQRLLNGALTESELAIIPTYWNLKDYFIILETQQQNAAIDWKIQIVMKSPFISFKHICVSLQKKQEQIFWWSVAVENMAKPTILRMTLPIRALKSQVSTKSLNGVVVFWFWTLNISFN